MKEISEISKEEVNQELAGRLRLDWHDIWQGGQNGGICSCGVSRGQHVNPDFYSDPGKIQLLREIKCLGEKRFENFLASLTGGIIGPERLIFAIKFIDEDGLCAKAAVDYLRKTDGNS